MICYIPSKGRKDTKTYKLFLEANIEVRHFIEPQEIELYNVPNKVSIEQNDQGIAYVRNYMLDYAKKNDHEWVIMCDDDVTDFGVAFNNKCFTTSAKIWLDILKKAKKLPFEMYGVNYRQYAWHEKKEYSINTKLIEVCVLFNMKRINWKYREKFNLKEDRDFALQTIKNGNGIIKFNKLFYNCPAVGSNKGGLQKEYQLKKDEESAKKMCYEWNPFVKIIKKEDRIDIKTDVKSLAQHYKRTIK